MMPSRSMLLSALHTLTDYKLSADDRDIVFFDIDNTLYSASTKVSQAMGQRIHGASRHPPASGEV